MNKKTLRTLAIIAIFLILTVLVIFVTSYIDSEKISGISLNQFRSLILSKQVSNVKLYGRYAECFSREVGSQTPVFSTILPEKTTQWINLMLQKEIPVTIVEEIRNKTNPVHMILNIFGSIFSMICYLLLIRYMFSGNSLTTNNFEFVKSKTTFNDIAGMNSVKKEIMEVVDFLKNRDKYSQLECRVPKGILISGPPGNGKTLIAKAIAGEAGVNFISASASSFVEIFVGTGPKAVKKLFEVARKNAPCVIFLDEMDSLGSRNSASLGHSEEKKTINQFLAEMDGLGENNGILVIGATNYPNSIDPAATRAGRFDRKVSVTNPDYKERLLVFELYCNKIPLDHSVKLDFLATNTSGFSRADIENMVNEAKIIALRRGSGYVNADDFRGAFDKITMGLPGDKIEGEELRNTAYHEAGHAFLYYIHQKLLGKLYKATIIPHGRALGFVMPENKDKQSVSKAKIEAEIQVCLAGRLAEELFFGLDNVTSGCSSDLQQAREKAEHYVIYGMNDKYKLNFMASGDKVRSEKEKETITNLVNELINEMEVKTREIMWENRDKIENLAERLLTEETLTGEEVYDTCAGKIFLPEKYTARPFFDIYIFNT